MKCRITIAQIPTTIKRVIAVNWLCSPRIARYSSTISRPSSKTNYRSPNWRTVPAQAFCRFQYQGRASLRACTTLSQSLHGRVPLVSGRVVGQHVEPVLLARVIKSQRRRVDHYWKRRLIMRSMLASNIDAAIKLLIVSCSSPNTCQQHHTDRCTISVKIYLT
jgi:hypothetical protein